MPDHRDGLYPDMEDLSLTLKELLKEPGAADMGAVYILIGCLCLSVCVIVAILLYCTAPCWKKYGCFRGCTKRHFGTMIPVIQITETKSLNSSISAGLNSQQAPPWMNRYKCVLTSPTTNGGVSEDESEADEPKYKQLSNTGSEEAVPVSGNRLVTTTHDDDDRSIAKFDLGYSKQLVQCFRGTLTFALRFDFIHRVLMVHVIRANHLPAKNKYGVGNDPYIKMYLLPERRSPCKTQIHKKSIDPEFNEMFSFVAQYDSLSSRMLQFTVYSFDRIKRHDLIGNVIMRDLFEKSDLYSWTEYTMHIMGSNEKDEFGDLLLYLSYCRAELKLNITVAKAYNLRPMDITGASDPYVKILLIQNGRRVKSKKTSTKRANLNPVYNESFTFDFEEDWIGNSQFLIKIMDWDRIGSDDLLGCCILGASSPTVDGREQWWDAFGRISNHHLKVDGLSATPPKSVGRWHSLLDDVPNEYKSIPRR